MAPLITCLHHNTSYSTSHMSTWFSHTNSDLIGRLRGRCDGTPLLFLKDGHIRQGAKHVVPDIEELRIVFGILGVVGKLVVVVVVPCSK